MNFIDTVRAEIVAVKAEFKDAIVSSHKDNLVRKLEALWELIELYER
jgi:hypothetical protein